MPIASTPSWCRAAGADFEEYITEEKAGDYPEGRYECNLQSAIETGDQREIDSLLNHNRSRSLRLVVLLLGMVIVLTIAVAMLLPGPHSARPAPTTAKTPPPALDLPAADECRTLDVRERTQLAALLQALGKRLHIDMPDGISDETLAADLAALDKHLGTPDPARLPVRCEVSVPCNDNSARSCGNTGSPNTTIAVSIRWNCWNGFSSD